MIKTTDYTITIKAPDLTLVFVYGCDLDTTFTDSITEIEKYCYKLMGTHGRSEYHLTIERRDS